MMKKSVRQIKYEAMNGDLKLLFNRMDTLRFNIMKEKLSPNPSQRDLSALERKYLTVSAWFNELYHKNNTGNKLIELLNKNQNE